MINAIVAVLKYLSAFFVALYVSIFPLIETDCHYMSVFKTAVLISPQDVIFRRVATETGVDWCLLCAIAYVESEFNTELSSHKNGRGIMQITSVTANHFGLSPELLSDTFLNVKIAARLLSELGSKLNLSSASQSDSIKIILAGYNCGISNLYEARKLAHEAGVNYNHWDELKYFGKVSNPVTRAYVSSTFSKWEEYKRLYSN